MKAVLALADGKIYEGEHFGSNNETEAEIVFNSSMSGYQEVLGKDGDQLVAIWIWKQAQNAWVQG